MSNIVIPYRGYLTQLGDTPYEPPIADMIGQWKATPAYLKNSNNTGQPSTNGEKISRWNGDTGGTSMVQLDDGLQPIWCNGSAGSVGNLSIPAGLNGYPYIWFNYGDGESWLEATSSSYSDESIFTMYYVMDTNTTAQTSLYDTMMTNMDSFTWDGGWRIGADNPDELTACVGDWSLPTIELKSTWTNPRVFCLKWKNSGTPRSRFGMTGGGGPNYFTWGSSNYTALMANTDNMLWGTGRESNGSPGRGNIDMVINEAFFYEVYHSDTVSQTIMNGLKDKFGTS